jgi:hypothetical protein
MDLPFLGRVESFFSRSTRRTGLHPALSSAFMQSPPSHTWVAGIWPAGTGLDSGEIKLPPSGGDSTRNKPISYWAAPLVELWHCVAYWDPLPDSLAALGEALFRPHLVYPLASLDISGQRPVSRADASPNEALYFSLDSTPLWRDVNRQIDV